MAIHNQFTTSSAPFVGPAVIFINAIVLLALVAISAWLAALRRRVLEQALHVKNQEAAQSKLAGELEAQALLSRQMSMDLEDLRNHLLLRDRRGENEPHPWTTATVPMNLNRRGQILRLSRKGKSVAEIAGDLNIAQGEVELLLKVHDLGQKNPA